MNNMNINHGQPMMNVGQAQPMNMAPPPVAQGSQALAAAQAPSTPPPVQDDGVGQFQFMGNSLAFGAKTQNDAKIYPNAKGAFDQFNKNPTAVQVMGHGAPGAAFMNPVGGAEQLLTQAGAKYAADNNAPGRVPIESTKAAIEIAKKLPQGTSEILLNVCHGADAGNGQPSLAQALSDVTGLPVRASHGVVDDKGQSHHGWEDFKPTK